MKSIFAFFLPLYPSRSPYLCRRRSPNGWTWFVPSSFHSCHRRWDETNTHSVPQLHIMRLTHATLRSDVPWLIIHSPVLTHTHTHNIALSVSHTHTITLFSLFLSYFLTFSHSLSFRCLWEAYCYSCKPTSTKTLTVCPKLFLTEEKQLPPPVLSLCIHTKYSPVCVCASAHGPENENHAVHKDTLGRPSALFCCLLFVYHWRPFFDLRPQHQQQVVQAMERAKQVTMGELNASIGVRGLPPLPPTVCTSIFSSFLFNTFFLSCHCCFFVVFFRIKLGIKRVK